MKNKTKQRLKNGITTGLSAGLIGYLAKGPRTGLALGGAMGLAAALQDPSKQKEIDDIVDLRQKEKHAMTRLSKEMLQSFVEEVEKTAGLPSYLKKMTKKEFGVTKITEWPKDRRLQDVLSQHQAGKQLPLVGKAQKGRAAKEVRERSAAGFREGTAEHKWKNSKNSLKSKDKSASAGMELAGLGVLATPSVKTLMDRKADKKEKSHAKFETAGLGILAAHPAYEIGKKLLTKKAGLPRALRPKKGVMAQGSFPNTSYARLKADANYYGKMNGKSRVMNEYAYKHGRESANAAKKVLSESTEKKAAPSQAAMMKMHAMVDASKAAKNVAPATAQGTLRPASQAAHAGYADFMPAGRFSGAGQGLPSIQQRSMQHAQKVMAAGGGKMAPLQRVSAGAAQTGGVLGRIGKMFRGA